MSKKVYYDMKDGNYFYAKRDLHINHGLYS